MYTSVMTKSKKELHKDRHIVKKIAIDIAGFGLMILAPLLGWLPGPGGIPLFLIGLGLVSMNHEWAEKILNDFEHYRVEFTDKILMSSPKVSLAIDITFILALAAGSYLALTQESIILRGLGLGFISGSLLILLSNQKRFERIWAFTKRKLSKK